MAHNTAKMNSFKPIKGNIFVTNMEQGMQKTRGGIILRDDNFKDHGIKPRWGQVYSVGPDVKGLKPGEWVLVEHGRWTLRIPIELPSGNVDVWKIDPDAILLVSSGKESPVNTESFSY